MKFKSNKLLSVLILLLTIWFIFGQVVYADIVGEKENEIDEMIDGISGVLGDEYKDAVDIEKLENGEYSPQAKNLISSLINLLFGSFTENVIKLCGAILLSCLLSRIAELSEGRVLSQTLKTIQIFFVSVVCYSLVNSLFEAVENYIRDLDSLMTAYSGVLSEILLFGGNLSLSAVSASILAFTLEIIRKLTLTVLLPIIKICFSVSIASAVTLSDKMKYISDFFKKLFTTLCVSFMTVLTVIMSFQSVIASAADTVAMRSVKFAAANTVPIIGGLVSESLRTLGSAASLFKSKAGIVGILCLLAVTVIPVARLLGVKYCFSFGEAFSSFIGGDVSKTVLNDCSQLINYLIGTVVITTVYFSYFIFLFANLTGAISV